jgi:hypothetical protein
MFLIAALIGANAGFIMGVQDDGAEPVSFERTMGTKILNVYRYNSNAISTNDLSVFLDVNAIGSLDDLTCIVKSFKRSLNHDLLLVKMENKSSLLYWAGLGAGGIAFTGGTIGFTKQYAASLVTINTAPIYASPIQQKMVFYGSLVAAGAIAIPAAVYTLYGHYKYEQHQKSDIVALDAILEAIDAMQESEEQNTIDMQDVVAVEESKPVQEI